MPDKSESQVEVTAGYLATLVALFCWESFINKCLSTLRYLTPTGLAEVVFHSWPRWAARRFGVIPSEQSIHLGYIGPRATVYNIGQPNRVSLPSEYLLQVWAVKPKELSEYRRKEPKYPYLLQNGLILITEVLVWGLAMYFDVNWTLILLLVFVVGLSVFLCLEKFFGAVKRILKDRQSEVDLARYQSDCDKWLGDLNNGNP